MSPLLRTLSLLLTTTIVLASQRFDVVEVDAPYFPTDGIVSGMIVEMRELLQAERDHLDQKVAEVTQKLEEVQQKMVSMDQKIDAVEGVMEKLGSVEAAVEQNKMSLEQVAAASEEVKQQVTASEAALTRQLVTLATHQQLVEMKGKISTLVASANSQITEAMADLATVARMEEVVSGQMIQVVQRCSSCNLTDTVEQVLAMANDTQHSVNELPDLVNTITSANTQLCGSLGQDMERLSKERSTENELIGASVSEMQEAVVGLNIALEQILNYTRPPPPTTTPELTAMDVQQQEAGEMRPCEDSAFFGGRPGFNVCAAAVRFRKCNAPILSYHCCRSCLNSGQIGEEGPWRHMNYPRVVKFLDALQLMRRL